MRCLFPGLMGALLVGLLACSDAASDQAQLERFVEDVTGKVDEGLVERALGYTAFDEVPVDVKAPGHIGVYRAERAEEIRSAFRKAMRGVFWDSQLKVRSQQIDIVGSQADVALRLMTRAGPLRVDTSLEKTDRGWKVSKVHVERGF